MQYTLRQLLDDPSLAQFLTSDDTFRLRTDLEHFIEHEHVLTKRIQENQIALQFGNYSDAETTRMWDEISYHQATIQQLHVLYNSMQYHPPYNALSMPGS
jgi:hypothetical protein